MRNFIIISYPHKSQEHYSTTPFFKKESKKGTWGGKGGQALLYPGNMQITFFLIVRCDFSSVLFFYTKKHKELLLTENH